MKCKWHSCENEARHRSPFCSGTCKKRFQRSSGTNVPDKVGQEQVGQEDNVGVKHGLAFVPDMKVYGRNAVSYPDDKFETRPEPLDCNDIPDPHNRCIYKRPDGSRYLLDAVGAAHERTLVEPAPCGAWS